MTQSDGDEDMEENVRETSRRWAIPSLISYLPFDYTADKQFASCHIPVPPVATPRNRVLRSRVTKPTTLRGTCKTCIKIHIHCIPSADNGACEKCVQKGVPYVFQPRAAYGSSPPVLARHRAYQADHKAAGVGLRIFLEPTMIATGPLPTLQVITDEILPACSAHTAGGATASYSLLCRLPGTSCISSAERVSHKLQEDWKGDRKIKIPYDPDNDYLPNENVTEADAAEEIAKITKEEKDSKREFNKTCYGLCSFHQSRQEERTLYCYTEYENESTANASYVPSTRYRYILPAPPSISTTPAASSAAGPVFTPASSSTTARPLTASSAVAAPAVPTVVCAKCRRQHKKSSRLTGDTTPLNTYISFVTNVNIKPPQAGITKNVLVYWDRGDLTRGDEAKMVEMGINL
ncbi:hypothetical protein M436DRAFT_78234 [Aureobasidium namibiae CBS 147.97]|uniref:Uncharacterized protein n=1 Tax=Aureobasidium namibiae CBS 147.97 TaxID=1043004 RepID=A0A074XPG8_9PEZI